MAKQTGSYLPDRFDDVEADVRYIGTHRRQQSSLSVFAPIGIGLGLVVILVLAGLWFIDRNNDSLDLDPNSIPLAGEESGEAPTEDGAESEEGALPASDPVEDPTSIDTTGLTITVLNGTETSGLAARAGARLQAIGWPEPTATNAEATDVAQSIVAYGSAEDLGIALGIAMVLGIDSEAVIQTDTYPGARITVVLGTDYVDTEST